MLHVHPRWLRVVEPNGSCESLPATVSLQRMEELWHVANPQPQVMPASMQVSSAQVFHMSSAISIWTHRQALAQGT